MSLTGARRRAFRGRRGRHAAPAIGCFALLLHLLAAPALPGCHCRHDAETRCPHDAPAELAAPTAAAEGAHCHLPSPADPGGKGSQEAAAGDEIGQRVTPGDGPAMNDCDTGAASTDGYRVGVPSWPVVELVEAPELHFEPVTSNLFERLRARGRTLDRPPPPPPRSSSLG